MANRVASIVVRTRGAKRNWVAANGKTDPPGSYYIRWCEGKTNRFAKAGANYAEAEIAQLRKERSLNAALIGAVIPEEAPAAKAHRVADVIRAYLADFSDSRRPLGSIKSKKTALQAFDSPFRRFRGRPLRPPLILRWKIIPIESIS